MSIALQTHINTCQKCCVHAKQLNLKKLDEELEPMVNILFNQNQIMLESKEKADGYKLYVALYQKNNQYHLSKINKSSKHYDTRVQIANCFFKSRVQDKVVS